MGAPSSLTVALPACFPTASGGALLITGILYHVGMSLSTPYFTFSGGQGSFFYSVFYTHILAIMYAI